MSSFTISSGSSSRTSSFSSPTITGSAAVAPFNRGPVITSFTPPTSCLSTLTKSGELYFGHDGGGYYDPSCFPTGSINSASQSDPWGLYWYSPAQCPSGWSSVPIDTYEFTYSTTVVSLDFANSLALCCPAGYTSVLGGSHQCQTEVFGVVATTFYYKLPTNIGNSVFISTDPDPPLPTVLGGVSGGTATIFGDGIVVIWQSTDITAFTSGSGTTSSTLASTNTTSTTSNSPPANTTSPSRISSGLSTGAKIGMGVGIPIFVILLAIAGFFCYRRRAVREAPNIPMYRPDTQPEKEVATTSPRQPYSGSPTHNASYPQQYQGSPPLGGETPSNLQRYSETQSPTFRIYSPMDNSPGPHELSHL